MKIAELEKKIEEVLTKTQEFYQQWQQSIGAVNALEAVRDQLIAEQNAQIVTEKPEEV